MTESGTFWDLARHFMNVIHKETGFPVLIYDTKGYIIQATDASRIGDLHAGAECIMQGRADEYSVTPEEALQNPLIREGHSCPIYVHGKLVAGFGITGKLQLARPLAKIAVKMINSWIEVNDFQEQLIRSERRYRSVFDHSMNGIIQAEIGGRLRLANKAAADILGYPSPGELTQKVNDAAVDLYVDAEDRRQFLDIVKREGRISRFNTRFRTYDGGSIDININATVQQDPETEEEYIQGVLEDITDIKRAEEAIRSSEEKYAKAFNNSPVWVVLSSLADGRMIEVNETYLRTMGYTRDEIIGTTSIQSGSWVDPADRRHIIDKVKKNGKVHNCEVRRRTKDGRILTMLFHAEIITISGEQCLLSVSLDITDRKAMEENLRISENNLRITLNSIGDAVIATDTKSIVTRMNPKAEELTGWNAEDAKGKPLSRIFRIIDGRTGKKLVSPVKEVLKKGDTVELSNNTVLTNRQSRKYHIAKSGAPIRDAQGKIEGVVIVFRDVTESYRQTQRIQENERLLNNITANIPGVVFQIQVGDDNLLTMRYVSRKFHHYFGIDGSSDNLFEHFLSGIPEDDREAFLHSFVLAALQQNTWQYEGRFHRNDNVMIWFSGSAIPQLVNRQTVFYGVLLDITARKVAVFDAERLEAALAQSQKMEAIGTLAGGIAHDFNNILTAVVGYSQLSLMKEETPDVIRENLHHIMNAGMRARDLVGQILTFSRQKKLELMPLQLGPLIKESVKLLRASLPATIDIEAQIENDIPNVMADPTQIHQIVMNLSTNAAQAIEDNIGWISIRLSQIKRAPGSESSAIGTRNNTYVKLEIEDSGKGIPPDIHDRIFEPYFTTKGVHEGTGLGLSVVHGIVKSYNGFMEMSSEMNRGTIFSIYLPTIRKKGTVHPDISRPIPTGSETILLVDDEEDVLDVGQQMLTDLGYTVIICNGGHQALEICRRASPDIDLVISDLTMPKMSGGELAVKLHEIDENLPIIFWSGYSSSLSQEKLCTLHAKGFLIKPILPSEIGELVRKVLDNH